MRNFSIDEQFKKLLAKLKHKDKVRYESVLNKMKEIASSYDVEHYKNLRNPLQFLKRVQVDSHFILVFHYLKHNDTIVFYDLDHHDKIYKKRFKI